LCTTRQSSIAERARIPATFSLVYLVHLVGLVYLVCFVA